MKYLFIIILACLFTNSYSQISLIGKWRRINPDDRQAINGNKEAQPGDLTLYPDSTFQIEGDTTTQNSTTPGWHSGGEYKGTWEQPNKNHLNLFLPPKQGRLFLPYLIITLTNEKLVIRSTVISKKNKLFNMTYRRI